MPAAEGAGEGGAWEKGEHVKVKTSHELRVEIEELRLANADSKARIAQVAEMQRDLITTRRELIAVLVEQFQMVRAGERDSRVESAERLAEGGSG